MTKAEIESHDAPDRGLFVVHELSKSYGQAPKEVQAIERIDVTVQSAEFLSIVGPSGCGKTTLLMCLAGLRTPSSGSILLHGRPVTEPTPGLSVVFQNYRSSLFPWYRTDENVRLALWDSGLTRDEQDRRVQEALHSVDLEDLNNLYPWQLSGGMQQRVALARALVTRPEVLLMDEPFASVDAQTRSTLEDLLLNVWEMTGVTIVFVTHDIDEAAYLSDRVLVLSSRPSTVMRTIDIELPRPRDQITTRSAPEFVSARTSIYELVMTKRSDTPEADHV